MARRRRRYPPYDPRYDPRYDPYAYRRGGWGPGYGYGYRPGNSCLRDACLLETGCCIAESLDGGCLVASVLLLPQFARALSTPAPSPGAALRPSRAASRLIAAVGVYQREISASRPPVCRFTPSCSEYAVEAVERHGALRGGLLAVRRLLRCRPGGARGADPVSQ